jgi:hypothetical protein
MTRGAQGFRETMLGVLDSIVDTGIDKLGQWVANWIAQHVTMKALSTAFKAHEIATTTATEAAKTAATAGGVAARAGVENAGFFTRILAWLGINLGAHAATEAGKTAATTAGVTTRTIADKIAALAQIATLSGLAGAGGVASMAAAPFPIDLGAPAFGAAMAAAAASFGAIASAAGGWGEIDRDQMAMVHKKEMILPASIAEPLRRSLKGGFALPGSGGLLSAARAAGDHARAGMGGKGGDTHLHYGPQISNPDPNLERLLEKQGTAMRKWIKNEQSATPPVMFSGASLMTLRYVDGYDYLPGRHRQRATGCWRPAATTCAAARGISTSATSPTTWRPAGSGSAAR